MMVLGKCAIWVGVVRLLRYRFWTALLVAVGLTQIGEFSYVLVQIARDAGLIVSEVYSAILAASLLPIVVNVFLVRSLAKWALRAGHPGVTAHCGLIRSQPLPVPEAGTHPRHA
jgi:CPA2 family monovalent cation:H+ antiporter-2